MPKSVLILTGSARSGSVNFRFATAAAKMIEAHGGLATLVDMSACDAPIYSGDIETEKGIPQSMLEMKDLLGQHDGLLVVSPEYNGCVPPLLVNIFSWVSRPREGEKECDSFAGKIAAVAAAAPGPMGGVRVIPRLRDMLTELGITVVPGFATLPMAFQAFGEDGQISNEKARTTMEGLVKRLLQACT